MSKIPRFVSLAVPDADGEPVFMDYVCKDIADGLLEALENICQRLEQMQYDHNTCDGDLVLEKARAAIAKVKGEQQ